MLLEKPGRQLRRSASRFIAARVAKRGGKPADNMQLDPLIDRLVRGKLIPKRIVVALRTIQNYGNLGAHDQGDESEHLTPEFVIPCLHALSTVASWHTERVTKFYGIGTAPDETVSRMIDKTAVTSVYAGNGSVPTDESSWKSKEEKARSESLWEKIGGQLKRKGIDIGKAAGSNRRERVRENLKAEPIEVKLHLQHTEPRIGLVLKGDGAEGLFEQLEKGRREIEDAMREKKGWEIRLGMAPKPQ